MPLQVICEYCAHCDADLTIDALWQVPGSIAIFCYACAKDLSRAVTHGHVTLADLRATYEEDLRHCHGQASHRPVSQRFTFKD